MDSHAYQALIVGDDAAWEQFYADMAPLIRNVCAMRVAGMSGEDLDDLIQAVFEKLLENDYAALRAFNVELDIAPYVATIALNAARDMAKTASRWREITVGGSAELEEVSQAGGFFGENSGETS